MSKNPMNHYAHAALVFALASLAALTGCDEEPTQVEQLDQFDEIAQPPQALEPEQPKLFDEPIMAYEPEDFDPDDFDHDDLYIESISTGGTGCPYPGTVTSIVAEDRRSFLLIFDEMQIEYPPGPQIQNKTCSAGVKLHIPQGYQIALATVNTRGYAYLDPGIRARHTSKYFFAGDPIAFAPHASVKGPFDDLYDFTDYVPFESLVWSPCGGSAIFGIQSILNLNAKFNPDGYALFSNDTIDGRFQQLYHIKWKEC